MPGTPEKQPSPPAVATSAKAAPADSPKRASTVSPARSKTASPTGGTGGSPAPTGTSATGAPAAEETVEAGDGSDIGDGASTMDDRISTYTASVASSVVDYPQEYGRRYHAYRAGAYPFPNDEAELDRLDFSHALMMKILGGKIYMAPIEKEKTHRILDIGTGTGIWAIQMGDMFPNAEIIGNDLSAIQPTWVPPNVKFTIDDVESPWVEDDNYDYIMCRYMVSSIKDWPALAKTIYKHVNPGGWGEFQDICIECYSEDGTLTESHALLKWCAAFKEAAEIFGRDCCPGKGLKGWVEDAGFDNIFHKRFKIPLGPWPKDKYYSDLGMHNLIQYLDGLEGFSMRALCGALGWTREEAQVLMAEVRKELKTGAYHAMFDFHVAYGQKPTPS